MLFSALGNGIDLVNDSFYTETGSTCTRQGVKWPEHPDCQEKTMGLRRKALSLSSFGIVPFRSNGDKLAKMSKQEQRKSKVDTKKDRNLQEQILAEQRRANDLKEAELRAQYAQNTMEDPPDNSWPDRNDELRRANSGGWWGYSNPANKDRRG